MVDGSSMSVRPAIEEGRTVLGIESGSISIKALFAWRISAPQVRPVGPDAIHELVLPVVAARGERSVAFTDQHSPFAATRRGPVEVTGSLAAHRNNGHALMAIHRLYHQAGRVLGHLRGVRAREQADEVVRRGLADAIPPVESLLRRPAAIDG